MQCEPFRKSKIEDRKFLEEIEMVILKNSLRGEQSKTEMKIERTFRQPALRPRLRCTHGTVHTDVYSPKSLENI